MENNSQKEEVELFIEGTIGTITVDAWPRDGGGQKEVSIPISFSLIPSADFVGTLTGGEQMLFLKDDSLATFPVSDRMITSENGTQVIVFELEDEPGYMFKCFLLEAKNNHNKVRVVVKADDSPDGWEFFNIERLSVL